MPTPKTTKEWRKLADRDPLHFVATWEGTRGGGWNEAAFYELGRSDWQDFEKRWREYEPDLGGVCVEIGCGAGRLTSQLVHTFDEVVAIDVSPAMLALTAQAAPQARLLQVKATEIPLPDASAQAIFSCHVFQHLEGAAVVTAYLREARRVLCPGGTLMVHIPVGGKQRSVLRTAWWEGKLALSRRFGGDLHRYRRYLPETLRDTFALAELTQVELHEFTVQSNGGVHAFWLARRA
jgi:ubiquinone/menaquinone biosynthesis C-methylase UbiE